MQFAIDTTKLVERYGAGTTSIVDVPTTSATPHGGHATVPTSTEDRPGAGRRRRRRRLARRPRRLVRAAHVVVAGGWLGLVVAMLVLGVAALAAAPGTAPETIYRLMDLIGGRVIPPVAVATLGTGLALSLLTPWGLLRHWWIVIKIAVGVAVIVSAVSLTDGWLEQAVTAPESTGPAGARLVATSVVHLVLLAFATVISVDRPWGPTPRGRRTSTREA